MPTDVLVDDALRLESCGIPGYLLHTPGHTSGSISAVIDGEIAIVGDAMFGIFPNMVLPPFADNVPLLVQSWKKLLETGCRVFLQAHGSARSADLVKRRYAQMIRRIQGRESERFFFMAHKVLGVCLSDPER